VQLVERARGGTDISSFPRPVVHIIPLVLTIGLVWLVGVWFGNAGSTYTGVSAQLCRRRWRIACSRWLYNAAPLGGFPNSAFYSSTIHSQLPTLPICTAPRGRIRCVRKNRTSITRICSSDVISLFRCRWFIHRWVIEGNHSQFSDETCNHKKCFLLYCIVFHYHIEIMFILSSSRNDSDHVLVHCILPDVHEGEGGSTEATNETTLKKIV